MKCVILAGGLGTRISEESVLKPKPMIEIGGKPIIWHIMKIYSAHGIHDFVVCLGYKGYVIKEYFSNYLLHMSDVTFDIASGNMEIIQHQAEPWRVTLIDTGLHTQTGGRIGKILPQIGNDEAFCLTYGDGVANINLASLIRFHKGHGGLATVTAVTPTTRFGHTGQDCPAERLTRQRCRARHARSTANPKTTSSASSFAPRVSQIWRSSRS